MKSILKREFNSPEEMEKNLAQSQIPFQIGLPNNDQTSDFINACIVSLCCSKKFVGLIGSNQIKEVSGSKNNLLYHTSKLVTSMYCNDPSKQDLLKKKFVDSYGEHAREHFKRECFNEPSSFLVNLLEVLKDILYRAKERVNDNFHLINDTINCLNDFCPGIIRTTKCANGHVTKNVRTQHLIELTLDESINFELSKLITKKFQETTTSDCNCELDETPCRQCPTCIDHVKSVYIDTLMYLTDTIIFYVNIFENDCGGVSCFIHLIRYTIIIKFLQLRRKQVTILPSMSIDLKTFLDRNSTKDQETTYELTACIYHQGSHIHNGRFSGI